MSGLLHHFGSWLYVDGPVNVGMLSVYYTCPMHGLFKGLDSALRVLGGWMEQMPISPLVDTSGSDHLVDSVLQMCLRHTSFQLVKA